MILCDHYTIKEVADLIPGLKTRYADLIGCCKDTARDLLKQRAVILVSPDEVLCDGAYGLHQQVSVMVCHCGVFSQDMVQIPKRTIITMINKNQNNITIVLLQYKCSICFKMFNNVRFLALLIYPLSF